MNRKQRRAGRKRAEPLQWTGDPLDLHARGVEAFAAGDLAAAAELIGRAIAGNSAIPSFHYNLGIVLKASGRLEEARASYCRAIALKPDHVNAHNNLGNVLKALGRTEEARTSFERALRHNPRNADTHYNLGLLCCDLGSPGEAAPHFRRSLECDPGDRNGAAILLAHLGEEHAPPRTPPAQLLGIYDVRARFWDQEPAYFGAALVADGLRRHASQAGLDILDLGCGTGLVGAAVRGLAGRLDGVDLSPAMLEKAKAKRVYDCLFEAELVAFMAQHKARYDALLGAAALIHFGDLQPLFWAASGRLRDKGLFVFTLFPHPAEADYAVAPDARLAQSGCFAHSPAYVARLATEAGFSVLALEQPVHEHDREGNPLTGLLAVLQRP